MTIHLETKAKYDSKGILLKYKHINGRCHANLVSNTYSKNSYIELYGYKGYDTKGDSKQELTPKNLHSDMMIGILAAHEFGHVLGLADQYLEADINKITDEDNNSEYYRLFNLSEVPKNEIMAESNGESAVNVNDVEMILMAAIENLPQSFIHKLTNSIHNDELDTYDSDSYIDYSYIVLSKAIRSPLVIIKSVSSGDVTNDKKEPISFKCKYLNRYSLELRDCDDKKHKDDSFIYDWIERSYSSYLDLFYMKIEI